MNLYDNSLAPGPEFSKSVRLDPEYKLLGKYRDPYMVFEDEVTQQTSAGGDFVVYGNEIANF